MKTTKLDIYGAHKVVNNFSYFGDNLRLGVVGSDFAFQRYDGTTWINTAPGTTAPAHNHPGSEITTAVASANQLSTGRQINGTVFNGTGNITTATWGTARTITIGSSSKSFNGSGNISWSLSEIGAPAETHAIAGGNHTASTFALLNGKVSDATLVSTATLPVYIGIACSDEESDLEVKSNVTRFVMPDSMVVKKIKLSVSVAPTGSPILATVAHGGTTIGSLTIAAGGTVGNVTLNHSLTEDALIRVHVTQVGSTITGHGLKVWLIGTKA